MEGDGVKKGFLRKLIILFMVTLAVPMIFYGQTLAVDNVIQTGEGGTRIHFISLYGWTDAILLESEGHYGLIDGGEDWDEPDGISYPVRPGVSRNFGFDEQVIHYLESVGVQKLDFLIGTHAHSDHIGASDEIISAIPTDRLYIKEYDDTYLLGYDRPDDRGDYSYDRAGTGMWDNQKIYDDLIRAAQTHGTQIISDFEENEQSRHFSLGAMDIRLLNFETPRDENGKVIPVGDANSMSFGVYVSAYGRHAFLGGDMSPEYMDLAADEVMDFLVGQTEAGNGGDPSTEKETGNGSDPSTEEEAGQPEKEEDGSDGAVIENGDFAVDSALTEADSTTIMDEAVSDQRKEDVMSGAAEEPAAKESGAKEAETKAADESAARIDLLKPAHHGSHYNNTTYALKKFNPVYTVLTGSLEGLMPRMRADLEGSVLFSTSTNSAAVIAKFSEDGLDVSYGNLNPGWWTYNGAEYYFNEYGRPFLDQAYHTVDGRGYYFNQRGAVLAGDGPVKENGQWRFLRGGRLYTGSGWQKTEQGYYYATPGGMLATGWQNVGGAMYYMDPGTARMVTGPQYIDDKLYYFAPSGAMQKGWQVTNGGWHYFESDGSAARGWRRLGGTWYFMDCQGLMLTGWRQIDGVWYYLTGSGAMATGWQYISGRWYYLESWGGMHRGWLYSSGRWYYMDDDGAMATGWRSVGGTWYYMTGSGAMATGWQYVGGRCYYLESWGGMHTGWLKQSGRWYYMESSGAMAIGWRNVGGTWYYLTGSGAMATGWLYSAGHWYFLESWGGMHTGWLKQSGRWYYMDDSGAMATGWRYVGGSWYYMESSGKMAASRWIGNYYVGSDGSMATSRYIGPYYVGADGRWIP